MSYSEWKVITFQESGLEIEDGDRGKNYPNKSQLLREGYCPFLNNKNVAGDKLNFEETDFITKEKDQLLRKGKAYRGDIILTTRGSVGNVALFDETIGYEFIRINSGMVIIRNNDLFDLKFLYQQLKSPYMKTQYKNMSTGSAQPQLPIRDIRKLELLLPPLQEQKSIAHILSTLDDKIDVNKQINKTLENMAQAIFKQWFLDFEFPNEDGEPYKSSGGEMIESDHGLIPKGWEVGKFIDLIEITSGNRPGKRSDLAMEDCKYPLVGASSIMGYTDDFNFEEKILVIGRVGTHGVVQRFNNKVWASDNTLVIKSDNYEFAYQILNQIDYKAINRGSTQPLITQTDIKNYTLIIPTEGYLNKFELLVGSLFEIHSNHCIENSKLTEIRDSLLPKLMSGEIRVPLDEEGDAS